MSQNNFPRANFKPTTANDASIISNADKLAAEAKGVLNFQGCGSISRLESAAQKAIDAFNFYTDILSKSAPDAPFRADVSKARDETVSNLTKITDRIRTCKASLDPKYAFGMQLRASMSEGIAQKEIEARINMGIQKKNICNYKTLDYYVDGAKFKTIFDREIFQKWKFKQFASMNKKGYSALFYGPKGTGKTLLAEAIAGEMQSYNAIFFSFSGPELNTIANNNLKNANQYSKVIDTLFERAQVYSWNGFKRDSTGAFPLYIPVVVLIDDIDLLYTEMQDAVADWITGKKKVKTVIQSGKEVDTSDYGNQGIIFIGTSSEDGYKGLFESKQINVTTADNKIMVTAYKPRLGESFQTKLKIELPTPAGIRRILYRKLKQEGVPKINMNDIDFSREHYWAFTLQENNWKYWVHALAFYEDQDSLNKLISLKPPSEISTLLVENDSKKSGQNLILYIKNNEKFKEAGDKLDELAFQMWERNISGAEIDIIFRNVWVREEQKAIEFYNLPENNGKFLYQKWLLDRRNFIKKEYEVPLGEMASSLECAKEKMVERFAFIPVCLTSATTSKVSKSAGLFEGDEPSNESLLNVGFKNSFGVFSNTEKVFDPILEQSTTKQVVKCHNSELKEDPNKMVFVVVTERETMYKNKVKDVLEKGKKEEKFYIFKLVRRQDTNFKFSANYDMKDPKDPVYFVPTVPYNFGGKESLGPDRMPVLLGACQFDEKTLADEINRYDSYYKKSQPPTVATD